MQGGLTDRHDQNYPYITMPLCGWSIIEIFDATPSKLMPLPLLCSVWSLHWPLAASDLENLFSSDEHARQVSLKSIRHVQRMGEMRVMRGRC